MPVNAPKDPTEEHIPYIAPLHSLLTVLLNIIMFYGITYIKNYLQVY